MDNENSFEYEEEKNEQVVSCEDEAEQMAENIATEDAPVEDPPAEEPVLDKKELEKKEKLKKKRKRWKVWYIVLLCLAGFYTMVLIMAGGIGLIDYIITREEEIDIDESFELSDLTDKQIISKHNYYIASTDKFFTNGFDYSDVDYDYSSCDAPECYFEATGFSGVKTISASCAEEAYIIFTIEAKSNSPKDDVKIVITSESEILVEIDANTSIMYKVKSEDDEHIFVKVLGDEADVSVTITRRIIGFNEAPDI